MAFEISVDASRGQYLSVPDVAVQWGADGAYVWIVDEGRAVRREIRLVKRFAGSILVEGDLTEGERVVIEGVQAVRAGAALKVISRRHWTPMRRPSAPVRQSPLTVAEPSVFYKEACPNSGSGDLGWCWS